MGLWQGTQARSHRALWDGQCCPRGRRLRRRLGVLDEELHRRVASEDELTGEQPIGDAARSIDIGTVIHGPSAERLLRSNERGCPPHDVVGGDGGKGRRRFRRVWVVNGFDDAEVQDFDEVVVLAVPAQDDVGRLDVAMYQRNGFRLG
jgi:hypothetical protein